jgi:hypothetical protein
MPRIADLFWAWGDPYPVTPDKFIPMFVIYIVSWIVLGAFINEYLEFQLTHQPHTRAPKKLKMLGRAAIILAFAYSAVLTLMSLNLAEPADVKIIHRARVIWSWATAFIVFFFFGMLNRSSTKTFPMYRLKFGPELTRRGLTDKIRLIGSRIHVNSVDDLWKEFEGEILATKVGRRNAKLPRFTIGELPGQFREDGMALEISNKIILWARKMMIEAPTVGELFPTEETVLEAKQKILLSWFYGAKEIMVEEVPEAAQPAIGELTIIGKIRLILGRTMNFHANTITGLTNLMALTLSALTLYNIRS